jgi:hypothetical protein
VARPTRSVGIPDLVWDEMEEMAREMGSDRESLVNSALYTFASLNGYLKPSDAAEEEAPRPEPHVPAPAPMPAPGLAKRRPESDRKQTAQAPAVKKTLDPGAELDRLMGESPEEGGDAAPEEGTASALWLTQRGHEPVRVNKLRFLIGRSKECDLIIDNPKVSREHAAVVREGDDYVLQDLGSGAGTWFKMQRITHRKIEDGDEYVVCSERLKFSLK